MNERAARYRDNKTEIDKLRWELRIVQSQFGSNVKDSLTV
jgi:hypothetical protein